MNFSEIIGQTHLKNHLLTTIQAGRIPHAQLFSGVNGTGLLPMALAYASEILSLQHPKDSDEYQWVKHQVAQLTHPDLHFFYPVNTTTKIKTNPVSDDFAQEWRDFVIKNPYGSLFEWLQHLGIEKKQGNISRREAGNISRKLALKAFGGGYKVAIIWMADLMHSSCSNAILKIIEEPSDKTVLILLAEREEKLLTTIKSRCQKLSFPLLAEADIAQKLIEESKASASEATKISRRAQGDYNNALQLLSESGEDIRFEAWFVEMVRTAFSARSDRGAIRKLLDWAEVIAAEGRETQKKFLTYSIEIFRQALLLNYQSKDLVYYEPYDKSFALEKFAPFVNNQNILEIQKLLEDACYHIERNAHGKITFTDVAIKMTHLIHKGRQ